MLIPALFLIMKNKTNLRNQIKGDGLNKSLYKYTREYIIYTFRITFKNLLWFRKFS